MSPFVKQRGVCSHTFHSIGLHGFAFSLSSSEIFGLILLVVALTATTNRTIFPVWDSVVRTVCFCSRCATSTQGITWSYSLTVWWHIVINIAYAMTLHEINNRQIGITHNIFCVHMSSFHWLSVVTWLIIFTDRHAMLSHMARLWVAAWGQQRVKRHEDGISSDCYI